MPALTNNHQSKMCPAFCDNFVPLQHDLVGYKNCEAETVYLVGQVGNSGTVRHDLYYGRVGREGPRKDEL